MSTTTNHQQALTRPVSIKVWALLLLTALLGISTIVLGIGYSKTQSDLDSAQSQVTALEQTVQEQKSTIETFQADTQYWSLEEQKTAIAIAAAAVGVERRGVGNDFPAYLFHIETYGTENFRTQIEGTQNTLRTRGIVRVVDSTDFSQEDKATVRIGFSGVVGPRKATGYYNVTLVKASDGAILVDSFAGSTFQ